MCVVSTDVMAQIQLIQLLLKKISPHFQLLPMPKVNQP